MKTFFRNILLSLLAVVPCLFSSCGGDDDPATEPTPQETILLRSSSLTEGSVITVGDITEIILAYNNVVAVSSSANITLNGTKCSANLSSETKMKVVVKLPELDYGKSYKLEVPEGSIVSASDAKVSAAAFTLNFSTKEAPVVVKNEAIELTKKLGLGWNLGNHFDSYDSGNASNNYRITWSKDCPYWDGENPTEELYKNLANAGIKTVRIPVTWGPYEDMNDGNYTIDATYMATVKQNVLWAKNQGLNVIINTHHDEYWMDAYGAGNNADTNTKIKERLTATWKQIAEAFKEEGDYLILEAFNELNHNWATPTAKELTIQNEWNQLCVDVIRAVGGENATRWIAVPSYQANIGQATSDKFIVPTDAAKKIIVAVHCYDPYNFTLQDPLTETWGHGAGNSYDESNVVKTLNSIYDKYIVNNQPCYLGEIGCSIHTTELGEKCRKYYLEYFCRAAHFAGLSAFLWDNNVSKGGPESHCYFTHGNGTFGPTADTMVPIMKKALESDDATYTLESIYANAPKK